MQRVIYLRRLSAARDPRGLQQQLERAFQRQLGPSASVLVIARGRTAWRPAADVYEANDALYIVVELPGMRDAEIEISLDDGLLRVRGARPERREPRPRSFHQMGINYGPFELDVFLPRPIDADRATASYDDGFLTIALPAPPRA